MHNPIDRRSLLAMFASTALTACGGGGEVAPRTLASAPPPPSPSPSPSPPIIPVVSAAVAVKWSDLATNAMLTDAAAQPPGLSPMEQSRILAMAFLAGHDALNNIARVYRPFAHDGDLYPDARPTYTYEIAVCNVLKSLLPLHAIEFDQVLQASLVAGNVYAYGDEMELGWLCAARVLGLRGNDGSANAQGPYTPGTAPGDYQPTPPVNVATFVNWGAVQPFVMASGDQFRAVPPYDVASPAYANDFNEVKSLGAAIGSSRTLEQSEIASFWLESTPLSWQRIATGHIADPAQWSLWHIGRGFAALQMAQADAYIACLESKYHYNFWRPITAIRAAATDGNPDTAADLTWAPFDPVTPPVPEYPSAHAAAATAGAGVLSSFMAGDGLSYRSSTGAAARTFSSPYYFPEDAPPGEDLWSQVAREIGLSRIYVGYHFRHAVEEGWRQGQSVADWVVGHALPKA